MNQLKIKSLPDVAFEQSPRVGGALDRVGMQSVDIAVQIYVEKKLTTLPAKLNLYVDLADPKSKGIHMSRLYTILN